MYLQELETLVSNKEPFHKLFSPPKYSKEDQDDDDQSLSSSEEDEDGNEKQQEDEFTRLGLKKY